MRTRPRLDLRLLIGALGRASFSLLCGGISYSAWLAAALLTSGLDNPLLKAFLWLRAPIVTAFGFAAGIAILERGTRTSKGTFLRVFLWPLVGCTLGAVAVYWFGPMLIVFAMLAAGAASVFLRQVVVDVMSQRGA